MVRAEEVSEEGAEQKIDPAAIMAARGEVHSQYVSENLERYIAALVVATREPERYPDSRLSEWIEVGSSPRASINLDRAARAWS